MAGLWGTAGRFVLRGAIILPEKAAAAICRAGKFGTIEQVSA